jgi:penicillin-binding protein-related factor A (putative recombinase)
MKNPSGRVLRFYLLYLRGNIPRSKGKADLSGMLMGGQFFALEVKRRNEKPTKEQLEYLAAVRDGGGIAAVVRSFSDAKNVLFADGIKAVLAEEERINET